MNIKKEYWLCLITFVFMITANTLAVTLPLNGKSTGELSDSYPNLFVPAGGTFSIWGLIYSLIIIFLVKISVDVYRKKENELQNLRYVWINFLLNGVWIFFWHYQWLFMSLVIMIGILVTLILHNNKINGILEKITFGIYLGWICVATIANVTTLLVNINWTRLGISEEIWTIIMIVIGGIVGAFSLQKLKNPYLAFSLLWAFVGIYVKRSQAEVVYNNIIVSLYFGGLICLVSLVFYWFGRKSKLIN
jgi:hypothetical protein